MPYEALIAVLARGTSQAAHTLAQHHGAQFDAELDRGADQDVEYTDSLALRLMHYMNWEEAERFAEYDRRAALRKAA